MRHPSIRVRMTLWYGCSLALAMFILASASAVAMRRTLDDALDAELRQHTVTLANRLGHELAEGETPGHAAASIVRKSPIRNFALQILTPDGTVLAASEDLGDLRLDTGIELSAVPAAGQPPLRTRLAAPAADPSGFEVAAVTVTNPTDGASCVLIGASSRSGITAALSALRGVALATAPLLVAVAGIGGWLLARRALAPVASMAEQARQMGADRLGDRLTVANPDDELGVLAGTFNGLLDRIEAAFDRMRQFMADASHEVRTPVGVIRSGTAVALTPPVTLEECVETLEVIGQQTERLSRLVDEMFLLARADAGGSVSFDRDVVDVDDLVAGCLRMAAPLARVRDVALGEAATPTGSVVTGDRSRLTQMLMNLVANGIEHCRPGDRVEVRAHRHGGNGADAVVIEVADTGPGIPVRHREDVFSRFFRLDPSRSRATGGSGLGLPIARAIADLHGGTLTLAEAPGGGCVFTVTLPAADPAGGAAGSAA